MFLEPQNQPITTKPADPFTLPALIAWLETMPEHHIYVYWDGRKCLIAQYLKARGYKHVYVSGDHVTASGEHMRMPDNVSNIPIALDGNWTFGSALTRARKALSDQQSRSVADTVRSA